MAFQDLANLVQEQGEMIDTIDDNISRATNNTEEGVKNIVSAEKHQKGTRKICLYTFGCVLFVVGVIALIVVITSN